MCPAWMAGAAGGAVRLLHGDPAGLGVSARVELMPPVPRTPSGGT